MFTLPKLQYDYDSLEPFFDAQTMEIHHTKHHQTYVDKLNETLKDYPELINMDISELLKKIDTVPEEIRQKVINFGGGHYNHSFFWQILTPSGKNTNFEKYLDEFIQKSTTLFGSGWTWLVKDGNEFKVTTTKDQDTPIIHGETPVLGIDLWEHAYYLKYQNRRSEYIESFLKVVNWDKVQELSL